MLPLDVLGHLPDIILELFLEVDVFQSENPDGKKSRILRPRLADGHCCHGNAPRHLDRGQECVQPLERCSVDGDPDHGQNGLRRDDPGQVRRRPGADDDHPDGDVPIDGGCTALRLIAPQRSLVSSTPQHQALYRRWRSQRFAEVVGQDAVVTTLATPSGPGGRPTRTSSSARAARARLARPDPGQGRQLPRRGRRRAVRPCPICEAIREGRALDVVELDAASNNRVDDIRELLPRIYTAPADLPPKVFIVDEVQRITQGWDVLLKTLEEPPPHVLFIFCTTDSSQIRPAVLSRVQRFDFRPLPLPLIEGKLRRILEADGRVAEPAPSRWSRAWPTGHARRGVDPRPAALGGRR